MIERGKERRVIVQCIYALFYAVCRLIKQPHTEIVFCCDLDVLSISLLIIMWSHFIQI
jgi:hypothetical protein